MEAISYKLQIFEGPMDLLLHLITKHKLNINDIPIIELVEQYTDYIKQMQENDMEVASEFIEMAARLVYIKTVSLLPVYEEAEKLKRELTGELLEYRDCKLMAGKLSEMAGGFDLMVKQSEDIEPDYTYTRLHEGEELYSAYVGLLGKLKRKMPVPVEVFKNIVAKKIISVSSKISFIYSSFAGKKSKKFLSFFQKAESVSDMVATFLAILEMVKSKALTVDGEMNDPTVSLVEEAKYDTE